MSAISTTFGDDLSLYQKGLKITSLVDMHSEFFCARVSKGAEVDPEFAGFRKQAEQAAVLFGAYHFLYAPSVASIARQVAAIEEGLGKDTSIPIWIDLETSTKGKRPTLKDALALRDALRKKGYRVVGLYYPHWYWEQTGKPSLKGLGLELWASAYVHGYTKGSLIGLYTGNEDKDHWKSYGDLMPVIWQFTSSVTVKGFTANTVDGDAFRGSRRDLVSAGLFRDFRKVVEKDRPHARAIIVEAKAGQASKSNTAAEKKVFASIQKQAEGLLK